MRSLMRALSWVVLVFTIGGTPGISQSSAPVRHVPVMVLVVRPHGFEPDVVTTKEHHFFLVVQNLTGAGALTFHLTPIGGNPHADVVTSGSRAHHAELLDLTPGTWVLTEDKHASWTCQITVQ
jgi:hypothetical protein